MPNGDSQCPGYRGWFFGLMGQCVYCKKEWEPPTFDTIIGSWDYVCSLKPPDALNDFCPTKGCRP